jgi:glycosyltransferase involved in cell wall biosynthesis
MKDPMDSKTPTLAVLILTHNEEIHIGRALKSIAQIPASVYIVDSGSTDKTIEIAEAHGAMVLRHPWKTYADQFQWGLDNMPFTGDWIMRLDADEIIEPDLAEQIRTGLPRLGADVAGVTVDRKHVFEGRWIKHGGRYPLRLLRLFRRGQGRIEQRWMDEHLITWGGKTVHFTGGLIDENLKDLTFFTDKHNKYAVREAVDVLNQRLQLFSLDPGQEAGFGSKQAAFKRFAKERFYNRLPFELAVFGYFLYRFIIQLGFLDGRPGLTYHVLQGFWYRYLVGAKVRELGEALKGLRTREEMRQELRRLTGLKLDDLGSGPANQPPAPTATSDLSKAGAMERRG